VEQASPLKAEGEKGRGGEGETLLPSPRRFSPSALLPLSLCIFALALRLWGLHWGLPDQRKLNSYHPDEGVNLVSAVLENGMARPHLDINFYNYGSLYFYLWQAGAAVNKTYGFVSLPSLNDPNTPKPDSRPAMILVGRFVTALLGALTVWALFALGSRLYGRPAGLLAGLAYAVIPAAVVHGHYATVDVPATFFVTVALVFGARLLNSVRPRDAVLAGLFAGLAAATKYNAGIVLLAPLAALYLQRKRVGGVPRATPWIVTAGAAAGFLVGCPGVLLNWPRFWHDFTYELQKSGQGMGPLFVGTGPGWVYHLTSSLWYALGVPLLLLSLGALLLAFTRRTRQDWYLLAFFIPYYLVIGWAQVRFLRYVIPLLPVFAVLVGRLLTEPWKDRPALARALTGAGIVVGLLTLVGSASLCQLMTQPDPRDEAADFIMQTFPPGTSIGFGTTPWYWSPPLSPHFTAIDPVTRRAAAASTPYSIRLPAEGTEWDLTIFQPSPPQHVILSNLESEDALRVVGWGNARAFMARVQAEYGPRVFESRRSVLGVPLPNPSRAPNDWMYIFPRVTLFTRE
jgi:hypothetical protein